MPEIAPRGQSCWTSRSAGRAGQGIMVKGYGSQGPLGAGRKAAQIPHAPAAQQSCLPPGPEPPGPWGGAGEGLQEPIWPSQQEVLQLPGCSLRLSFCLLTSRPPCSSDTPRPPPPVVPTTHGAAPATVAKVLDLRAHGEPPPSSCTTCSPITTTTGHASCP